MSKKKFPNTVYVKYENAGTVDEYLSASPHAEDHAETGETVSVGLYQLVAVRKIVCKPELVD